MIALRARDTDRANCRIALDAAYADGQLTFDERKSRQNRCDAGQTLDDLRALIADLQVNSELPVAQAEAAPPTHTTRRVVAGFALLLVLGGGAWVAIDAFSTSTSTSTSTSATSTTGTSTTGTSTAGTSTAAPVVSAIAKPIVASRVDFTSVDGLTQFVALYNAKFGDSVTDSFTFFPLQDYAVVGRATTPGRVQSYVFRGGFSKMNDEAAAPSNGVVDFAALDVPALVAAMKAVPDTMQVPGALIGSVQYEPDSTDGTPTVEIYAADPAGAGGSIALSPAGTQLKVYSSAF